MNFFKNIISLIMLFSINSIHAKRMGGATYSPGPTTVVRQQPIIQPPVVQQPPTRQPLAQQSPSFAKATADKQEKSYRDLVNYVKKTPNAWDRVNNQINPQFISTLKQKARQLNLDALQLQALLEMTRDVHAAFFNDRPRDVAILNWVNHQIREALK